MADFVEQRFGFASLDVEGLPIDLKDALLESWKPGTSVSRYGRQWDIARVQGEIGSLLLGRIGFTSGVGVPVVNFDRASEDFIEKEVPSGHVVPFVVDTDNGLCSYQLFSGVVRETTFTGALQDLLNSGSRVYRWKLSPLAREVTFERWFASITRLVEFDIELRVPNPHYEGRPFVESVMESLRAEVARLRGRNDGPGLDAESPIFRQAMDHVLRNYGKARVTGAAADAASETWVGNGGRSGRVASTVTIPAVGAVAGTESLVAAIRSAPSGLSADVDWVDGEEA